ncbi:MAG: translation initiation factor IF-1 [Mycoplasmataceae bacterium]|jgi:translation initiation factor IF-1|nr:translation initiation factor IF-1 [Mycoplasmataceae bacterium]
MAKNSNTIQVSGTVTMIINSLKAKVLLENGMEVIGIVGGKVRLYHLQLLPGDKVTVELSTYDLTKGRIIARN